VKREELLVQVTNTMSRAGFEISQEMQTHYLAFDILAKRDRTLLIVKVLSNVDSLRPEVARDLNVLASFLKGQAILVAPRSGRGHLFEGVVYTRHNLPLITPGTLHNMFVEGVPPFAFSAPGGLFVKVDEGVLKEVRAVKNISIGRLADAAGVSRRAISQYEAGMSPSIEVALRLEEALGEPIVLPIDPLTMGQGPEAFTTEGLDLEDRTERAVNLLTTIGYEVVPVVRCPFNAFSLDRVSMLLTGVGARSPSDIRKAEQMGQIAQFVDKQAFLVVEGIERDNIGGTPVIRFMELRSMECTEDVKELISERTKLDK